MERKKILIVDDKAEIRKLLSTFFKKKGHEVAALESGVLGLNLIAKEEFDILISDIRMPYMDGVEFARRAKRLDPNLVILLLTGYASLETAQQAIKIGINDYMTKPVDLEKLQESIEEGLQRSAKQRKNADYYRSLEEEVNKGKEDLESMKRELILLISHELKTSVTIISEGFSLLKDTISVPEDKEVNGLSDDKKEKIFAVIERGRRRLIEVIDNLNYYMTLSKGEVILKRSKVELGSFLETNSGGLQQLISERKSSLKQALAQEEQAVNIDKEKFLDLLSRIVHNAAYHNPQGTEITLKTSIIKKEDKEFVEIEICDNGKGIDKEILDKIFIPFSIGDMVHHSKGIGLGLSICKKVVELHEER